MVRLSDLDPIDAAHLLAKESPTYETEPFVAGPRLGDRRVAIVTTSGVHRRTDQTFHLVDTDYRVIPGSVAGDDLVMSHSSVNFDRSGFQQDVNVVFPIDRLRELESTGEIGSIARFHYAVNGATWLPHEIEPTAREIAGLLKEDGCDAALLVPV